MILEVFDYLTTPASKESRKNGQLYHSISLYYRAQRCSKYWEEHLENCKKEISNIPKVKRLGVLGSGLMLETPVDLLLTKCDEIYLIDVVHLKFIRKVAAAHSKIFLVEADLNYKEQESKVEKLNLDFVISANLLSQLNYIETKMMSSKKTSQSKKELLSETYQKYHLDMIKQLAPRGLLYSDFELIILDQKGNQVEKAQTVSPSLNIKWTRNWIWNISPIPELSKNYAAQLRVGVFRWTSEN